MSDKVPSPHVAGPSTPSTPPYSATSTPWRTPCAPPTSRWPAVRAACGSAPPPSPGPSTSPATPGTTPPRPAPSPHTSRRNSTATPRNHPSRGRRRTAPTRHAGLTTTKPSRRCLLAAHRATTARPSPRHSSLSRVTAQGMQLQEIRTTRPRRLPPSAFRASCDHSLDTQGVRALRRIAGKQPAVPRAPRREQTVSRSRARSAGYERHLPTCRSTICVSSAWSADRRIGLEDHHLSGGSGDHLTSPRRANPTRPYSISPTEPRHSTTAPS